MVTLIFVLSAPGNLSETDDVYAFAHRAETFSYQHVSDPRLMLYHMSMRGLYVASNALLPDSLSVRALSLMRFFSALCGALALAFAFRIMREVMQRSRAVALYTCALLGASYGFWRYAAEAEVYIPAIATILGVFLGLFRWQASDQRYGRVALLGVFSGLAVLLYQPSVIPLLMVFPLLLWARKLAIVTYGTMATAIVVAGYLWGYSLYWPAPLSADTFTAFLAQRSEEFVVPPLSFRTVVVSMLQAGFAIGHDVVSFNGLFALDVVQHWVGRLFPYHVIREEVFMTQHLSWRLVFLALNGFVLLASAGWLVWKWVRQTSNWQWDRISLTLLGWLVLNGAIIGRLNPAGIEAWIMILPPLFLVLGAYVFAPLWLAHHRVCLVLLAALMTHNLLGGIALVYSPQGEYHRFIARQVIAQGEPQDLVIVSGDAGLVEALRYLGKTPAIHVAASDKAAVAQALTSGNADALYAQTLGRDFRGQSVADHIQRTLENRGRIWVFEDFFYGDLPSADSPLLRLKRKAREIDQTVPGAGLYQIDW